MKIRVYKYASPFIIFIFAYLSFTGKGWMTFLPVYWAYLVIPILELMIKPDEANLEAAEEEMAKSDKFYDYMLYMIVPLLYSSIIFFLFSLKQKGSTADFIGRTLTMGLLLGAFGINVAHELGHRAKGFEKFMAKMLLLPSLYMHFIIEHNRGHHKKVGTLQDSATSRANEPVFSFYWRTIVNGYKNAWQIANNDRRKRGENVFSFKNEMVAFTLIQIVFIGIIFSLFGWKIGLWYWAAAASGVGLLETVNYIEHYGLQRKEIAPGKYERTMPYHSWNSNHVMGRLMLFELSRHSDHHYVASRKYQVLRHHDNSPQMPTGYPGMMILSLIPPLFFYVMKRQMKKYDFYGAHVQA